MRFLYRAMKFAQEYGAWFRVDGELKKRVEDSKGFYDDGGFLLNQRDKAAQVKTSRESIVEKCFAGDPRLIPGLPDGARLYRQLKVGVFKDGGGDEHRVFPGKNAAIDFWTLNGETLTVFELKAMNGKSGKAGILTELMFYCNLLHDVFVDRAHRRFLPPEPVKECGLDVLTTASPVRVEGVMLTDRLHSLITPAVLREMNKNASGITYRAMLYSFNGRDPKINAEMEASGHD